MTAAPFVLVLALSGLGLDVSVGDVLHVGTRDGLRVDAGPVGAGLDAEGLDVTVARGLLGAPDPAAPAPRTDPPGSGDAHPSTVISTWQEMPAAGKAGSAFGLAGVLAALVALATRFGIMGLALFSRIRDRDVAEHPTRARILQTVEASPGVSRQELRRTLGVAWGTAVYHLDRLEGTGHLVSSHRGGRRRYWANGAADRRTREQTAALSSPTTRLVAFLVLRRPGAQPSAIAEELGLGRPTASKHLARLADVGLVRAEAESRARHYFPTAAMDAFAHSTGRRAPASGVVRLS